MKCWKARSRRPAIGIDGQASIPEPGIVRPASGSRVAGRSVSTGRTHHPARLRTYPTQRMDRPHSGGDRPVGGTSVPTPRGSGTPGHAGGSRTGPHATCGACSRSCPGGRSRSGPEGSPAWTPGAVAALGSPGAGPARGVAPRRCGSGGRGRRPVRAHPPRRHLRDRRRPPAAARPLPARGPHLPAANADLGPRRRLAVRVTQPAAGLRHRADRPRHRGGLDRLPSHLAGRRRRQRRRDLPGADRTTCVRRSASCARMRRPTRSTPRASAPGDRRRAGTSWPWPAPRATTPRWRARSAAICATRAACRRWSTTTNPRTC